MPNVSITIYLPEKQYMKYIENKVEINKKVRKLVRKEINKNKYIKNKILESGIK